MTGSLLWVGEFDQSIRPRSEAALCAGLESLGVVIHRIDRPWRKVGDAVQVLRPSWVIFSKCRGIPPSLVAEISARGTRTAQVLFDLMDFDERRYAKLPGLTMNRLDWWIPFAREVDVVICKEEGNFDRYAERGIKCEYLDQAAFDYPSSFAPSPRERAQIGFFGRWSRSRSEALRFLGRDRTIRVFSDQYKRWRHQGFESFPTVFGPRFSAEVAKVDVVWGESATHSVAGYWSDRRYQVMANEGCFLTRYTPGLESTFQNWIEIVWYNDLAEANQCVEKLLADEVLRSSIARSAAATVRAQHTYRQRAAEFLRILEANA